MILPIVLFTLAIITQILHEHGLDFQLTVLRQNITLFDVGTALLVMGLVLLFMVLVTNKFSVKGKV